MNCPVCGERTNVIGSKSDCESVYRERICAECGHIFYTEESETHASRELYRNLLRDYWRGKSRNRRMKKKHTEE